MAIATALFLGLLCSTAVAISGPAHLCQFQDTCGFRTEHARYNTTWNAGDIQAHNLSRLIHSPLPDNTDGNVLFYPNQSCLDSVPKNATMFAAHSYSQRLYFSGYVNISMLYYVATENKTNTTPRLILMTKNPPKVVNKYNHMFGYGLVTDQWTYLNISTYFEPGLYQVVFFCGLYSRTELCAINYLEIKNYDGTPVEQISDLADTSAVASLETEQDIKELYALSDWNKVNEKPTPINKTCNGHFECEFNQGNCSFESISILNLKWNTGEITAHNISSLVKEPVPNNRGGNVMYFPHQSHPEGYLWGEAASPQVHVEGYATLSFLYYAREKALNNYTSRVSAKLTGGDNTIHLRGNLLNNRWVYYNVTTFFKPATYRLRFYTAIYNKQEIVAVNYVQITQRNNSTRSISNSTRPDGRTSNWFWRQPKRL